MGIMRRSQKISTGIGLASWGFFLMLPWEVGIPFVIGGLVFIAWAVWPLQIARITSRLPRPIAKAGTKLIDVALRVLDQVAIIDLKRELKIPVDNKEEPLSAIRRIHDVATIDVFGIANEGRDYKIKLDNLYFTDPNSSLLIQVSDDGGSTFYSVETSLFEGHDFDHNRPISIVVQLIAPAVKGTEKRLIYECLFADRVGEIKKTTGAASMLATTEPVTALRFISTVGTISRCNVYIDREG